MSGKRAMEASEINNLAVISDNLVTAGQPSESQIRVLAMQGFQIIINLGLNDPRYCLHDEAALVKSLNMEYHHIPVDFALPEAGNLSRFFELMRACGSKKVFVHCAANYRVSSFVSLYAQAHLDWPLDQAVQFVRDIWEPDAVWTQFIQDSRKRLGLPG